MEFIQSNRKKDCIVKQKKNSTLLFEKTIQNGNVKRYENYSWNNTFSLINSIDFK